MTSIAAISVSTAKRVAEPLAPASAPAAEAPTSSTQGVTAAGDGAARVTETPIRHLDPPPGGTSAPHGAADGAANVKPAGQSPTTLAEPAPPPDVAATGEALAPTDVPNPVDDVKTADDLKPTADVKPSDDVKPAADVKPADDVKPAAVAAGDEPAIAPQPDGRGAMGAAQAASAAQSVQPAAAVVPAAVRSAASIAVEDILDEMLALPTQDRIDEAAPLIAQINDAVVANVASGVDSAPVLSAAGSRVMSIATEAMHSISQGRRTAILAGAEPRTAAEAAYVESVELIMRQYLDTLAKLIAAKSSARSASREVSLPLWPNPYLARWR